MKTTFVVNDSFKQSILLSMWWYFLTLVLSYFISLLAYLVTGHLQEGFTYFGEELTFRQYIRAVAHRGVLRFIRISSDTIADLALPLQQFSFPEETPAWQHCLLLATKLHLATSCQVLGVVFFYPLEHLERKLRNQQRSN